MKLPPEPSFTFLLAVSLSAGVVVAALAWLLLGAMHVARGVGLVVEALLTMGVE